MAKKAESTRLWHRRYGHLNVQALMYLYDNELVTGLPKIGGMSSVCEPSVCGKHAKMPLAKESSWRA